MFHNPLLPSDVSPDATERRWEREAVERMRTETPAERYRSGPLSWPGLLCAVGAAAAVVVLKAVGVCLAVA